jgi:hypothetical protein
MSVQDLRVEMERWVQDTAIGRTRANTSSCDLVVAHGLLLRLFAVLAEDLDLFVELEDYFQGPPCATDSSVELAGVRAAIARHENQP